MITWDAYLKTMTEEAKIDPKINREACERAFVCEREKAVVTAPNDQSVMMSQQN